MNLRQFLTGILFPRTCSGCRIALKTGVICDACLAAIPLNQTLFCATCDARLPYGKKICHPKAPCVIGGAGPYASPALKELVLRLKFKGIREAAQPLAELIARYLDDALFTKRLPLPTYVIVPIPLSKRRGNERGFNQAEEIARRLAATMNMTMTANALVRIRNTKPQTEMNGLEGRLQNLRGCFLATPVVAGRNILLIDDVTTSGTTLREAARALRAAGARKIMAVAAAKA
jgi:ComF family protein